MTYQDIAHHYEEYDPPNPRNTRIAIITGGRNFTPTLEAEAWLLEQFSILHITCVYDGACRGADNFGHLIAVRSGILTRRFIARWGDLGKKAGSVRNAEMLNSALACSTQRPVILALPGGSGTLHMCGIAETAGVQVISYNNWYEEISQ